MRRTSRLQLLAAFVVLTAEIASSAGMGVDIHLGVKACSGAPCHGMSSPSGPVVLQNEHTTWIRDDHHSRAYEVLHGERAKRIARNLGIASAAEETLCLDCHADNAPSERRGAQFSIEDGIGCEVCHGGSERWLGPHLTGRESRAKLVELGMMPLDDPGTRAQLCLGCHFGTGKHFVDHRLMGAGHPRMPFELDTFTTTAPAHHRVDADYRRRGKNAPTAAQVWAVGQAIQARERLAALVDPELGRMGPWPELVLLDCQSCHRTIEAPRWSPRPDNGLGARPGVPRLDDANLVMLNVLVEQIDRATAKQLSDDTRALHAAISLGEGDLTAVATRQLERVATLARRLEKWDATPAAVAAVLGSLCALAADGTLDDYAVAEQAAMASQALATTLVESKQVTAGAVKAPLEEMLASLRSPEAYDRERLRSAFATLRTVLSETSTR